MNGSILICICLFVLFFFPLVCVFLPTFLQGLCACKLAAECGVLSSCEDTQTSQRVRGREEGVTMTGREGWRECFLRGDGGKCLCLRARAAIFPQLAGVAPAAGCCSPSNFTPCGVKMLKPTGPREQKGLAPWAETEWMTEKIFYKKREREKEKSVNKEQPFFLDVSKRGGNSSPDFYLYL